MITTQFAFTQNDCEIKQREVVYEGFHRFVVYHLRHRLFNGDWSPVIERELMERTSAAGVLPYDPVLDKVVLIYQFRPGAVKASPNAWLIEIIAGTNSVNEKSDELVIRESREEAGCDILDLYPISEYFCSPGGTNEYINLYCGRIDASGVGGIYGEHEENEDIYAFALPVEEAFNLLAHGKIKTGPAIIALQWLQIHRNFLRDLWLKKS